MRGGARVPMRGSAAEAARPKASMGVYVEAARPKASSRSTTTGPMESWEMMQWRFMRLQVTRIWLKVKKQESSLAVLNKSVRSLTEVTAKLLERLDSLDSAARSIDTNWQMCIAKAVEQSEKNEMQQYVEDNIDRLAEMVEEERAKKRRRRRSHNRFLRNWKSPSGTPHKNRISSQSSKAMEPVDESPSPSFSLSIEPLLPPPPPPSKEWLEKKDDDMVPSGASSK